MKDGIYVTATLDFDWDTVVNGIVSNSELSVSDVFDTDVKSDKKKLSEKVSVTIDRAVDSVVKLCPSADLKVILTITENEIPKSVTYIANGWQLIYMQKYNVSFSLEIAEALVREISSCD